jgi:regulator of nucleoside diphosphate kinase
MAEDITINSKFSIRLNGEVKKLCLVLPGEVDVAAGKISYLSPIGEAVLGKVPGQSFKVYLPNGKVIDGEVLEIS